MGDRTYVSVTVLKEHVVEAVNLITPDQGEPYDIVDDADGLTALEYEEVNYGCIDALKGFAAAGIPYSVGWQSGGSYSEGEEHMRFTPEGVPVTTSQDKDWPVNVLLDLQAAWKKEPDKPLDQHLQEAINAVQDPSWENQLEYSKIARARNLLKP